jgi:hypothetical protein
MSKANSVSLKFQNIEALVILFYFFTPFFSTGQNDSLQAKIGHPRTFKIMDFNLDFYTTLNGSRSINSKDPNAKDHYYIYYNFTFQNRTKIKKLRLSNYFFNEFGFRRYRDSISVISEDVYNFKNSLSLPFKKSKFDFNLTISTKSQFWPHYSYKVDSNNRVQKSIYTSYLSPGYTVYSGGMRFNFWNYSSIELGIASGRTTKIRNQDLFVQRKSDRLYGLKKGTYKKTTLGLHLLVNISTKKIFNNFYIEQFSQVFIDKDSLQKIRSYNVDVNNAFHYVFLKFIRLSIRTKFLYDQSVFIKPSIIQQVSIGFYLNNKLQ